MFKKIFGSGTEKAVDEAELLKSRTITLKDRADRVALSSWHDVLCESLDPQFVLEDPHCLHNLSLSGLALKKEKVFKTPDVGTTVRLRLLVRGQGLDTDLKIVRISDSIVAGTYIRPTLAFMGALKKYFMIEIAAMKMSPVKPEFILPSTRGTPQWYEGEKKSSLYFVVDHSEIVEFQMNFFSNVVEYSAPTTFKFGKLGAREAKGIESGVTVEWEKFWSADTVELSRRFIDCIPRLSEENRQFFHKILTKIPTQ